MKPAFGLRVGKIGRPGSLFVDASDSGRTSDNIRSSRLPMLARKRASFLPRNPPKPTGSPSTPRTIFTKRRSKAGRSGPNTTTNACWISIFSQNWGPRSFSKYRTTMSLQSPICFAGARSAIRSRSAVPFSLVRQAVSKISETFPARRRRSAQGG
jgi:hypothetical protein